MKTFRYIASILMFLTMIALQPSAGLQSAALAAENKHDHDHAAESSHREDDNHDHAEHETHREDAGHDHAAHAAHNDHDAHGPNDGHDHAAHDDHGDDHDKNRGDAHDDHDEHGHEGHDDHDDHDEAMQLTAEVMDEFSLALAKAGPGTLEQTLSLPGEVVFNADRLAHVAPAVDGIVVSVFKSVGESVEQGEVMAVLNSRQLAAARSEYLAATARLELARENLSRDERLFREQVGTERQVLAARQEARKASIDVTLAENNLHALGLSHEQIAQIQDLEDTQLNRYELVAPIAGRIIARHLTLGEMIEPSPDTIPFTVADLSSVWVNLTVYQRDLATVKQGQSVRITFGHNIPPAIGTIAFVSPALDEQTRSATARIVLDNPDRIWRPGLFVTGQITVGSTAADIVVPRAAIVSLEQGPAVFIETDEGFKPQPVTIGRTTERFAEITDGLTAGQTYVAKNAFTLKAEMQRGAFGHGHAH